MTAIPAICPGCGDALREDMGKVIHLDRESTCRFSRAIAKADYWGQFPEWYRKSRDIGNGFRILTDEKLIRNSFGVP